MTTLNDSQAAECEEVRAVREAIKGISVPIAIVDSPVKVRESVIGSAADIAAASVAEVVADRTEVMRQLVERTVERDAARDELAELKRQFAEQGQRLREALEPFARFGDGFNAGRPDSEDISRCAKPGTGGNEIEKVITLGDCRRARAALSGQPAAEANQLPAEVTGGTQGGEVYAPALHSPVGEAGDSSPHPPGDAISRIDAENAVYRSFFATHDPRDLMIRDTIMEKIKAIPALSPAPAPVPPVPMEWEDRWRETNTVAHDDRRKLIVWKRDGKEVFAFNYHDASMLAAALTQAAQTAQK